MGALIIEKIHKSEQVSLPASRGFFKEVSFFAR